MLPFQNHPPAYHRPRTFEFSPPSRADIVHSPSDLTLTRDSQFTPLHFLLRTLSASSDEESSDEETNMTTTLRTLASTTSKLRALLQESRKDLERIQTLHGSLREVLDGFFVVESTVSDGSEGAVSVSAVEGVVDGSGTTTNRASADAPTGSESFSDEEESCPAVMLAKDERLWRETLSLIGTGRVLGVAAQAEDVLDEGSVHVTERSWIGDGKKYARWMGVGVVVLARSLSSSGTADCSAVNGGKDHVAANIGSQRRSKVSPAAQLFGRALGLGYPDVVVDEVTKGMLLDTITEGRYFDLAGQLSSFEQRMYMTALLRWLEEKLAAVPPSTSFTITNGKRSPINPELDKCISGASAVLQGLTTRNNTFRQELLDHLLAQPYSISLIRSALAALPLDSLRVLVERCWTAYSDKLHIKHTPITQQECNARLLLLLVGNVHRQSKMDVFVLARSSHHTAAMSERMKSSSQRVRWLGMVVGMAVSRLVDEEGKRLTFEGVEDVETEEAKEMMGLIWVGAEDAVGKVVDLRGDRKTPDIQVNGTSAKVNDKSDKTSKKPPEQLESSKAKIIEVLDPSTSESEDDDLVPYSKPVSTISASTTLDSTNTKDATRANPKSRPKVPVYIRDLLNSLQSTDDDTSYDIQLLALTHGPSLIRRKADFGTELRDLATELASSLVGLQDTFDMPDWHTLRQNNLVALVVARPREVAPFLARFYFTGDLSLGQRATTLTALGLGGRELAGLRAENEALALRQQSAVDAYTASQQQQNINEGFPTRRLPGKLHELYLHAEDAEQDARSTFLQQQQRRKRLGQDLSADASKASNTLLAVSRLRETQLLRPVSTKQKPQPRNTTTSSPSNPKPKPKQKQNTLATLISTTFFFPLLSTHQHELPNQTLKHQQDPTLLSLFLKTLTLLLSAARRAAPSYLDMSRELWVVLVGVSRGASRDGGNTTGGGGSAAGKGGGGESRSGPLLEALLFSFLSILEVLQGKEVVRDDVIGAKGLLEVREWVGGVWEGLESEANLAIGSIKIGGAGSGEVSGGGAGGGGRVVAGAGDGGGGGMSGGARGDESEVERCKYLAAGLMLRIKSIVEEYHEVLAGRMALR